MRKLILAAGLMLGACGPGEDFTQDVNISAQSAYADLSRLSGGPLVAMASLPRIDRSKPRDGEIRYAMHSLEDHGDATVGFRVESLAPNQSRVHVSLDMPSVTMRLDGKDKYLSELKAEMVLRKGLRAWAERRDKRESATSQIAELDVMLGAFALAISPGKIDGLQRLAMANEFDFSELMDGDGESMADAGTAHEELQPEPVEAPDPTYHEERMADAAGEDASQGDWGN